VITGAVGIALAASLMAAAAGAAPAATHFASCNAEAHDAVRAGRAAPSSTVPSLKDEARAAGAQRGDTATSDDAQLSGMDADGAKNADYQAAYRTCMRRRGF
jgi:hypothetical protein